MAGTVGVLPAARTGAAAPGAPPGRLRDAHPAGAQAPLARRAGRPARARRPMRKLLTFLVRFYRLAISPMMAPRCRFLPTCSEYAIEAIERQDRKSTRLNSSHVKIS